MENSVGGENFECEICEKRFSSSYTKNRHSRTIHSQQLLNANKNFNCEICKKRFSSNQAKNKHINVIHKEEKNFACNVCSKLFAQEQGLILHVEKTHQNLFFLFPHNHSSGLLKLDSMYIR